MKFSKLFITSVLLCLLVVQLVHAGQTVKETQGKGYPAKFDCGGACKARCRLSSRPNLCKRACGTCCSRCNCVPPGTYGNYETCACYAALTTHGGKRKCP